MENLQFSVIPAPAYYLRGQAPAGIPQHIAPLDPRFRGDDGFGGDDGLSRN
jgi:hypothetical protein